MPATQTAADQLLFQLVPMQNNIVPRETSPSPSFRERQRVMKAHTMPIVPSVSQVLAATNAQQVMQQPSPTGSTGSLPARRSPPATSRISPAAAKLSSSAHMGSNSRGEHTPDRAVSPPPLLHSQSTPVVQQIPNTQPQIGMLAAQPRPVPRVAPPQFLSQYQMGEGWHVTEELLAEIERADQQQGQLQGTSGVAYAGGAASSTLHLQHTVATVKDPAVERVRTTDRSSPKEVDSGMKRQVREKERDSPKTRERSQTTSSTSSQHSDLQSMTQRTPEYRGSPSFHTPLSSPGERTAGYAQYIPESYQQQQVQGTAQSVPRKPVPVLPPDAPSMRTTPPGAQKMTSPPQPSQPVNVRATDRALPLQEEQEEDIGHEFPEQGTEYDERHHGSPTPSSDVYPDGHASRYDERREHPSNRSHSDSDDETLNEEVQEKLQQKSESEESSGFTPRSPTTNLPDRPSQGQYPPTSGNTQYPSSSHVPYAQATVENQKTVRAKYRVASTDQLGMRNLDSRLFDQNGAVKTNGTNGSHNRSNSLPEQVLADLDQQGQKHKTAWEPAPNRADSRAQSIYSHSLPPHIDDFQGFYDVPTSSYLQQLLRHGGNRPGAPIPPTPQSHTAAPSPSPLSAMPSDIEPRQVGSPYPYPFAHIRRTALSAAQNAPSTNFDHNNPDVVREQLMLQMQIYALNNGLAPPSDSTFSPSSTPFPAPDYNPWGMLTQAAHPGDSTLSMRSSPSHEPVPMSMPPYLRGRNLRRKDNASNLRAPVARRRVKPPPRVESTQPRDTSPEPSSGSGEETAGEEQFVDQYLPRNGHMVNGNGDTHDGEGPDDGEWIDEDEEDEEEDLLHMEYHPAFINSVTKRRRRWETRWDALTQTVQALDRETDATLIVLAAPSHSTKLHALTSRSIRRDPTLLNSPAMSSLRQNFSSLAGQRRVSRTRRLTLADRLSSSCSVSSADGSQAGGEAREEELRRALGAALGSLNALGNIYEQREARWRDEMKRLSDDRERVELLLRQALGPVQTNGLNGHNMDHPMTA
ncbi:hypothetical protein EIP86_011215 [Pleurotus ostreatoroseus]|nr:hypothetical protein EIP86_011215 [Pleurotus ostreatoroseus]